MERKKLRELQLVQLSIMKDIHRVCIEHNLRYYLVYGSALGAIRHHGVIPWDVDIDIAMPRKDYEAFVDTYSSYLQPRLLCVSYKTIKQYIPPHALVLMKDTKIIDKTGRRQTEYQPSEIFVDIFPLDVCPESTYQRKIQAIELNLIKGIKYRKAAFVYSENGYIKKITKSIIKGILSMFPWPFLNRLQQNIMKRHNNRSQSGLWCSMVGAYGYTKNTVPIEWYGIPKLVAFEDTELCIPEHSHEILSRIYGDYMQLPDLESQQKQYDYFVDAIW